MYLGKSRFRREIAETDCLFDLRELKCGLRGNRPTTSEGKAPIHSESLNKVLESLVRGLLGTDAASGILSYMGACQ